MTPRRYMPALLLLFVASGCAALIYEIVWFQLLQLVIGSSAVSLAVLLGTTLITGTYVFTDSINRAFDQIFTAANKGTDVSLTPKTAFDVDQTGGTPPTLPASVLDRVRRLPDVAAAGEISTSRIRPSRPTVTLLALLSVCVAVWLRIGSYTRTVGEDAPRLTVTLTVAGVTAVLVLSFQTCASFHSASQ